MSEITTSSSPLGGGAFGDAGEARGRIGAVQVVTCRADRVELRAPGELGFVQALVGFVPIAWCAAAWMLCLREHTLAERLRGCVALSLMAGVSAILMMSSLGVAWRFDGRRRRITRRAGVFGATHNARRLAGLRVESTPPSALSEPLLRMTLVDATGAEQFEIATWNRREVDRGEVEALAEAIRRAMGWA
jgi:hypothetical protein